MNPSIAIMPKEKLRFHSCNKADEPNVNQEFAVLNYLGNTICHILEVQGGRWLIQEKNGYTIQLDHVKLILAYIEIEYFPSR